MRQMDDLTNNSSIWYEYEEQKPVIIEGYQKRDTIKVSCSYIFKVEKTSVKSVISEPHAISTLKNQNYCTNKSFWINLLLSN